jgi:hypothetical protein
MKKPAVKKKVGAKKAGAKKPAAKAPSDEVDSSSPAFWPRWTAAYRAMQEDPRIQIVAPRRLAHVTANARILRMTMAELAEKSGSPTDILAPFAGDFFYTSLYWLGPKDESGLHPFGGEVRLQGPASLLHPFQAAPGWALFDDHPMAGDGIVTVVRPIGGRWQLGVLEHGVVTPLVLEVPAYMQALLDLRGAFGWQWLFAEDTHARRNNLSLLLNRVEAYFATDTSPYRARLR